LLEADPASWAHRAIGGAVLVVTVLLAVACVSYYELEDGGAHFGPTASAELEAREERLEERLEFREERQKEREEGAEEKSEAGDDSGGHSGPG
jgi:hypothetical protein